MRGGRGERRSGGAGVAAALLLVYLSQTVDGVTFELINVVGDTSRTVLGFRIAAPEGKLEQGFSMSFNLRDQWGNRIPGSGWYYRTEHEDDSAVFAGYINSDGMTTRTRHLSLSIESIGDVQGPWNFRFHVSYERAASLVEKYDVGAVSEEKSGVQLEVSKVELHATETVVAYVYHGLYGDNDNSFPDDWRTPPQLLVDGRPLTMVHGGSDRSVEHEDNALVATFAYEPLPEDAHSLMVVDNQVARRYSNGPEAHWALEVAPSFTYRITSKGANRAVELVSQEGTQLWGTTVSAEASIEGNTLTLKLRGTDGDLIDLTGFSLRDDKDRSYSLGQDDFTMDSETKMGYLDDKGVHFEYTLTYELEDNASEVTMSFPQVMQRIDGPWEVEFNLPE